MSQRVDRQQPALFLPAAVLSRAADHLAKRYAGIFSPETVERAVVESYEALRETATVHAHLAALAPNLAAERLTARARADGSVPKTEPDVLFICAHNAGRSQMAAALLDHHGHDRVHVHSAGSTPTGEVDPGVVEVMAESGLDLAPAYPKPLTDDVVAAADIVVTMGCGDACGVYPGKRYLDWPVADPEGQPVEVVREIRDEIDVLVRGLLAEL
ncbi:arsenate reductase ArsC [Rhodococcus spongiicola]|uniref:Arsenate reductase ArsC n=1 Tax=Rhodococcus spongiicola TaxID=2487352 RepID=A0A3S3AL46_9NOCA|nr:arsenate reductase ArsC [Rhodococcus spongiicola]RVW03245.1 arsenate reductase ArsC [Rhodococcus spongiicola]